MLQSHLSCLAVHMKYARGFAAWDEGTNTSIPADNRDGGDVANREAEDLLSKLWWEQTKLREYRKAI